MQIDYSPLTNKINDEDVKKFCAANRQSVHIISERFCKIIYGIIIFVLVAEVILVVAAGFFFRSFLASIGLLIYLSQFTTFPILLALIVPFLRRQTINSIKKAMLLTEFASRNGLYYREFNSVQSYPGIMFNIGYERKMCDQLIKESPLNTYEVSNYQYKTGSDNDTQVSLGYIMVKLGKRLPHMLLDSNANNAKFFGKIATNLPLDYKFNQKLSLEGDFDKYFTLYAPKEYKRDALYIFTPDLMAAFIDWSGGFDAEVIDDMLFVYSSNPFNLTNPDDMKKIFKIVKIIGDKMFTKADRYRDEKVGDRSKNMVAIGGQRLKKKSGLVRTIVALLVIFEFLIISVSVFVLVMMLTMPDTFDYLLELIKK